MVVIRGTVPTGLEWLAADEVTEKLAVGECSRQRGSVLVDMADAAMVEQMLSLRCFDRVFVVVLSETVAFPKSDVPTSLGLVNELIDRADWPTGLSVWESVFGALPGGKAASLERLARGLDAAGGGDTEGGAERPTFRATCNRNGKHCFKSPEMAASFGGALQSVTGWTVKMKDFNVEVVLDIDEQQVSLMLTLTPQSLHRRGLVEFGPTTLRPTICHGLLRLAQPQPGELLVDPLCGVGTIAVEAVGEWSTLLAVAGDRSSAMVERASHNLAELSAAERARAPLLRWDARALPLRDGCVDCVVTDVPFGKRQGSRADNRQLYPALLHEWARVVRGGGRAVLLSQDKVAVQTAVRAAPLWSLVRQNHVNVGGLAAAAFLLSRK